jgi:HEAT repeat protein
MNEDQRQDGAAARTGSRFQVGVKTLLVLIAACASILWATRVIIESRNPTTAVIGALRSWSATERSGAARELGNLESKDYGMTIPAITAALRDSNDEVREASAQSLGRMISVAVDDGFRGGELRVGMMGLIDALKDEQPAVRVTAALAISTAYLGRNRPPTQPVSEPVFSPVEHEIIMAAISESIQDKEIAVRRIAVRTAGNLGRMLLVSPPPPLIASLKDPSSMIRGETVIAVSGYSRDVDSAVPLLFTMLREDSPDVRTICSMSLETFKPSADATPTLVLYLRDRNIEVRTRAANVLGNIGPAASAAIPDLIAMITEPSDRNEARYREARGDLDPIAEAATALGKIAPGSPSGAAAIAPLTDLLSSQYQGQRDAAAWALRGFGAKGATALPALIAAMQNVAPAPNRSGVGAPIATALGRIAPGTPSAREAVAALVDALKIDDDFTRNAILKALTRFDSVTLTNALPRLRELENDPRPPIRAAVRSAVKAIASRP